MLRVRSLGTVSYHEASALQHALAIEAQGDYLYVWLDGPSVYFEEAAASYAAVPIGPTSGQNDGTAGIAFSSETNRGKAGGQRIARVMVMKR